MSWMENSLMNISPQALMAALQMKQQKERGGMQDGVQSGKLKAIQEQLAQQQLKSAQEANKMAELRRGMLTPTGVPGATDSPYSQGYPDYAKAQEKDKLLSLMNGGKAYTGIGDFGTGGGGGYGGGGGGNLSYADQMEKRQAEQSAHQLALNEGFNPTQPKPDTITAANALGNLYRPGGQDVPQTPMTPQELLAQEQSNTAGYQSLLNQKGGNTPQTNANIMAGTTPVQDADKADRAKKAMEINTWLNTGSTVPPSEWSPEMRNTAAEIKSQREKDSATKKTEATTRIDNRKTEKTGMNKYEAELYKDPHWTAKEKDGGIPAQEKENIKQKWLAYAKWKIKNGEVPDQASFWDRIFETE